MSDKAYGRKLLLDAMAIHDPKRARELKRAHWVDLHKAVRAAWRKYTDGEANERLIRANLAQFHWLQGA